MTTTETLTTMTVDSEFALTEARPAKKYTLRQPGYIIDHGDTVIHLDETGRAVHRFFRILNAAAVAQETPEGHE